MGEGENGFLVFYHTLRKFTQVHTRIISIEMILRCYQWRILRGEIREMYLFLGFSPHFFVVVEIYTFVVVFNDIFKSTD